MKWRIPLTVVALLAGFGLVGWAALPTIHADQTRSRPRPLMFVAQSLGQRLAASGQPHSIGAGQQATPRSTRAIVVRTPTPRPTPALPNTTTVDLSGAVLYQSDLPSGYRPFDLEEMGIAAGSTYLYDVAIAGSFAFLDARNIDLVYGLTVWLDSANEVAAFVAIIEDAEAYVDRLVSELNAEEVQEVAVDFPDGIGEEAMRVTFTADIDDFDVRVTTLAFLRGNVGATVITMHLSHMAGRYAAETGAAVLDGRIAAALAGLPTEPTPTSRARRATVTATPTLRILTTPAVTATRTARTLSRATPAPTITITPTPRRSPTTPTVTATRTAHSLSRITPEPTTTGTPTPRAPLRRTPAP